MSVNKAWRGGKRFRSADYISYEKEVLCYLPKKKHFDGELEIHYTFYFKKNFIRLDVSNCIKCLEDIMVRADIIKDDSNVIFFSAEKRRSDVDRIEVEIMSYGD